MEKCIKNCLSDKISSIITELQRSFLTIVHKEDDFIFFKENRSEPENIKKQTFNIKTYSISLNSPGRHKLFQETPTLPEQYP